jgi:hypothetical protein
MTNPFDRKRAFNAQPVKVEVLSPKDFLTLKEANQGEIASSRPAPARLGSRNFGGIEVTYTTPRYQVRL